MPPSPISSPPPDGKSPIKWDGLHCDPILDTVLVSKDDVHFRASSHALKRESSLFKGMLTSIPITHQSIAEAIPLDFDATVISLFLDEYCTSRLLSGRYGGLDLHTLLKYIKLLRFFDVDRLLASAIAEYQWNCRQRPVDWLIIASQEEDVEEGRLALWECQASDVPLHSDNVLGIVAGVHTHWRLPLLHCLLTPHDPKEKIFQIAWPQEGEVEALFRALANMAKEHRDEKRRDETQ